MHNGEVLMGTSLIISHYHCTSFKVPAAPLAGHWQFPLSLHMLTGVVAAARWYIFTLRERHRRQGTIPLRSYTTCHYFPTCFVYISWRNKTCHLRPRQDMRTDRPTFSGRPDRRRHRATTTTAAATASVWPWARHAEKLLRSGHAQWPRSRSRRFVNSAMRNAVWTIPCLPLHSLASGVTHSSRTQTAIIPWNTIPKKGVWKLQHGQKQKKVFFYNCTIF